MAMEESRLRLQGWINSCAPEKRTHSRYLWSEVRCSCWTGVVSEATMRNDISVLKLMWAYKITWQKKEQQVELV